MSRIDTSDKSSGMEISFVPHARDMRVIAGPANAGPRHPDVQHLATTPLLRYCQALAEGIAAALDGGTAAEIIGSVNINVATRRQLTESEIADRQEHLAQLDDTASQVGTAIANLGNDPASVDALNKRMRDIRREADALRREIQQNQKAATLPEPHHPVDVTHLLAALAGLLNGDEEAAEALDRLLVYRRITKLEDLAIHFEASLVIPDRNGKPILIGPFRFSSENIRRLEGGQRARAMANLCLENGWPARVVATGIPFRCASLSRHRVTTKISGLLRPALGEKAPQVIAAAEAPEVLAVVASALGTANPRFPVDEPLKRRIEQIYISKNLPEWFNISWSLPSNRCLPLTEATRMIHSEGRVSIERVLTETSMTANDLQRWRTAKYLTTDGANLQRVRCRCGSIDLCLIPTPEPNGLVCLSCREDRSGLVIPESWNSAATDPDYWSQHGYTLETPPVPGIYPTHLEVAPLRLR